jgi:ActR/RegA family two-component response regulator
VAAVKAGAEDCLVKPINAVEIQQVIAANPGDDPHWLSNLPSLAQIKADYLEQVLDSVGGNLSRTTRTLGIRRSTLQRKLKKRAAAPAPRRTSSRALGAATTGET